MPSKLLPQKQMLIDEETLYVLKLGYMTVYKVLTVDNYMAMGKSQEEAENLADLHLATKVGTEALDNYVNSSVEQLQLKQVVAAFNKANPFWKQLAVGVIAAGLASFIGTMFVQLLLAYFKNR
jgi:hypothetical protein